MYINYEFRNIGLPESIKGSIETEINIGVHWDIVPIDPPNNLGYRSFVAYLVD